jgi:transposase-like protein
METAIAEQNILQLPSRTKRTFSIEEKRRIIEEASAPGVSVASVARKNALAPSQLFCWRKELRAGTLYETRDTDETSIADRYRQLLNKIDQFQNDVGAVVAEKVLHEIGANKMSAYNAASAYSCIASAATKLETLKLEILDRLLQLPPAPVATQDRELAQTPEQQRELSRIAEKLLVELHRQKQRNSGIPA